MTDKETREEFCKNNNAAICIRNGLCPSCNNHIEECAEYEWDDSVIGREEDYLDWKCKCGFEWTEVRDTVRIQFYDHDNPGNPEEFKFYEER